ncbi:MULTISPECIES: hypothetical protein [Spirosoma]|uniref:Uncharacterized protein n=1 Tax=Spirosoma sordidisoli TaxID=2502893 RepID=A0A4Q2UJL7_9BACT|nr:MULTISPECIES: hypothetical protein [Spirosoma]RYC68812.1 hypothetical protein EQG79_15445 [Spirosoma sordidisoli]
MATTSPFDPDKVDPEFYSNDPNQHGDSDFGRESEGVGTNTFSASTSGIDMEDENREETRESREANVNVGKAEEPKGESYGSTQAWDVEADSVNDTDLPKGKMMSDEAGRKLDQVAENPSDDALFHRGDATYLEEGDDPSKGYDPHNKGYDGKDKESAQ